MTKEELQEFYQKNKVLAIGVPIILGILLLDQFVLKPARRKAAKGDQPAAAAPGQPTEGAAPAEAGPDLLAPPAPLVVPGIPPLSASVEKRFLGLDSYPYPATKNIFLPEIKAEGPVAALPEPSAGPGEPVVYKRPDLTYHGFFVMGSDRIAILKLQQRLRLLRAGHRLPNTPFLLRAIHPDRVEITDTENADREFEVTLSLQDAGGKKAPGTDDQSPLVHQTLEEELGLEPRSGRAKPPEPQAVISLEDPVRVAAKEQ